jgi:uncharacterized protein (DUF2141 family)
MKKSILPAASLLLLAAASARAAELTIEVQGIEKAEGQVLVALYDDEAQFLKKPFKRLRLAAAAGGAKGTFGDVPAGKYAATAFLDENGNGKLDMNMIGIPSERLGFSNDAAGLMGPPEFSAARFDVDGAAKSIVIRLR